MSISDVELDRKKLLEKIRAMSPCHDAYNPKTGSNSEVPGETRGNACEVGAKCARRETRASPNGCRLTGVGLRARALIVFWAFRAFRAFLFFISYNQLKTEKKEQSREKGYRMDTEGWTDGRTNGGTDGRTVYFIEIGGPL